jgi:hypothetical protein
MQRVARSSATLLRVVAVRDHDPQHFFHRFQVPIEGDCVFVR